MPVTGLYGLLAEFDSADALTAAARATREAGYTRLEAFAPYPVPEAAAAIGCRRTGVPAVFFLGGLTGGVGAYFMQWWLAAVDYPVNVGGRPLNSWPAFVPVTFELTVLTAAVVGTVGLFALCRLPRFHHPLFAAPGFARATTDGFYLCVEAADPRFDPAGTAAFLAGLHPVGVEEVPE